MREAVYAFADRGGVVYAECGGLMYLSTGIEALDGARYPMVGLIPRVAVMSPRLEAIGYVEVETRAPTLLGPAGVTFRGHQFRYSRLEARNEADFPSAPAYWVRSRMDARVIEEGFVRGNVLASYVHAHWASSPSIASSFVDACVNARDTMARGRGSGSQRGV
jgi:cobyrinic acid a,c-diamide synthase